jgi:hypothetical protein
MTLKYSAGTRLFDTYEKEIVLVLETNPSPDRITTYFLQFKDESKGWFRKEYVEGEDFVLAPAREAIHEIIGYDS